MKTFVLISVLWLTSLTTGLFAQNKKQTNVLPVQEKVYLHFDNNCYFLGDTIWYKAYVVLADDNTPQPLSKILYVELLNEQGYILERQQLVVDENGQANGQFAINDTIFAGYFEIRAYTKWMLNFGYEHIYSWYTKTWYAPNGENGWYPVDNEELLALTQQPKEDPSPTYIFKGGIDMFLDDEGKEIDSVFYTQNRQVVKYDQMPENLIGKQQEEQAQTGLPDAATDGVGQLFMQYRILEGQLFAFRYTGQLHAEYFHFFSSRGAGTLPASSLMKASLKCFHIISYEIQ